MTTGSDSREDQRSGKSHGRSTAALIMGILGLLVCQFLSPVAWYVGYQELKAIRSGQSPQADKGIAKAGMILGIIGTILLALGFLALGLLWHYRDLILRKIAENI
ncbi:MAG: DUF4190 domain-containing protein [Acidobacteriota bacterium]